MKLLMSAAAILLIGLSPTMAQSDDEEYEPVSVTLGGKERIPRTFDAFFTGGYGLLPLGGTELNNIYGPLETYDGLDGHKLNYGKGLKLETGVAWYMHTHLGLEAGFEYSLHLPKLETENSTASSPFVESYTIRMFGPKLLLKPVLTPFSPVRVYGFGGAGVLSTKLTYTNNGPNAAQDGYIETSPGFLLETGLGIEIPIGSRISVSFAAAIQRVYFETTERRDTQHKGHTHVVDESYSGSSEFQEAPTDIPGSNMAARAGVRIRIF